MQIASMGLRDVSRTRKACNALYHPGRSSCPPFIQRRASEARTAIGLTLHQGQSSPPPLGCWAAGLLGSLTPEHASGLGSYNLQLAGRSIRPGQRLNYACANPFPVLLFVSWWTFRIGSYPARVFGRYTALKVSIHPVDFCLYTRC